MFDLGGITLEVVEVPGHTHGSIGLLYKEEKIFFAGDAMNPFLWLFAPEATMLSEYKATLRKADGLDFEALVVSHGLSLATQAVAQAKSQVKPDVAKWVDLVDEWLLKRFTFDLPELTMIEQMIAGGLL